MPGRWICPVQRRSHTLTPFTSRKALISTKVESCLECVRNVAFCLHDLTNGIHADGGDDAQTAVSCSDGRRDVTCWSARYMFRTNGSAELYTYLPQPSSGSQFSGNQQLCIVKPLSVCSATYGDSVGRGSWMWKTGGWTVVSQRIKLNDVGQQNGEMEVIADGTTVINLKGLAIRDSDKGRFQGIQMQSFFGGEHVYHVTYLVYPCIYQVMMHHGHHQRLRTFGRRTIPLL